MIVLVIGFFTDLFQPKKYDICIFTLVKSPTKKITTFRDIYSTGFNQNIIYVKGSSNRRVESKEIY